MALLQSNKKKKEDELVTPIKLLPNGIRYLGWAIVAFLILSAFKVIPGLETSHPYRELFLAIGLLLFVISKEKVEDEMLMAIRLKSFFVSTTSSFLSIIIWISLNNIGNLEPYTPSAYMFMNISLMFYLFYFHSTKRKLKNEE